MLRPKQPIRPHQQDQQNDHECRDVLESIDDVGVDVPAGDRLDDPDGDTAEDGAGDAVQSSQDHGGQGFEPHEAEREVHAQPQSQQNPADGARDRGKGPGIRKDSAQAHPQGAGGQLVIRRRPHRNPHQRVTEEEPESQQQARRRDRAIHAGGLDRDAGHAHDPAGEDLREISSAPTPDTHHQAAHDIPQRQRDNDHGQQGLAEQRPHDHPFYRESQHRGGQQREHHGHREGDRACERNRQIPAKEHELAMRQVENLCGLVQEGEAKGDQRVDATDRQAVEETAEEKLAHVVAIPRMTGNVESLERWNEADEMVIASAL